MIYEKPTISFKRFHADAFLDHTDVLSANNPDIGDDVFDISDDDWGDIGFDSAFNGTITINSDGVGGWLNG